MAHPVLRVENLSKCYRIGVAEQVAPTLRGAIGQWLQAPFRYARSTFRPPSEEELMWALHQISFEVEQGEVIGIVGRNGAGKSTLLKILSRITDPTLGYAEIRGRVGSLLEVGTGFNPELTGRENIYLNGTIMGMRRREIDAKLEAILDFAGISQMIDTPVKRYSSGMYTRLAFAVAAHLEPEILIIDEVLAVGDAAFQKKCIGKIKDVVYSEGRTVLFVSHNMAIVQNLCSRALFLDRGKLVAAGDVGQVLKEYLHQSLPTQGSSSIRLQDFPRQSGLDVVFQSGCVNGQPLIGQYILPPEAEMQIELSLQLPQGAKQATIGIHFEDDLGARIYAVNTRWQLRYLDFEPGVHRIVCTIPCVPLVPGRYYLSIGFSAGGHQVDWLERVTCLELSDSDVYGTGELPWSNQGYFLARADWEISRDASQAIA